MYARREHAARRDGQSQLMPRAKQSRRSERLRDTYGSTGIMAERVIPVALRHAWACHASQPSLSDDSVADRSGLLGSKMQ